MMIVKSFTLDNVEYMVCDSTKGYVPMAAGIELLANRRLGVGADRVMIFTGTKQEPSFCLYYADGTQIVPERRDYLVFACYLKAEGIAANAAEMAKALGDQAILDVQGLQLASFEAHVTEAFCDKLRVLDAKAETMVG